MIHFACYRILITVLVINSLSGQVVKRSIQWNENWALACDFRDDDLTSVQTDGEDCNERCASTPECTHFTWTTFNSGTCWMKKGSVSKNDAYSTNDSSMVCGIKQGNTISLENIREDIKNGLRPIRGVNLGGWLVAEYWMTSSSPAWSEVPENIANQGEYQAMAYLGHVRGDDQFKQHRDSYITEQDFREISAANMNTVRIPVGYWITGFDYSGGGGQNAWKVYAPGAIEYLDRAIREWGPRSSIVVLISLHAAKGSQNGMDHSAPAEPGKSNWGHYSENIQNTLDAVEWLARRYKNDTGFLGISLLNEPAGTTPENVLKQYYYDAYGRIRLVSNCLLMISPLLYQQGPYDSDWKDYMRWPYFQNVRHEWHRYQIWGFEGKTTEDLIGYANHDLKNAINAWEGNWLMIGEWSIASSAPFNDNDLRRYAQAQLGAFQGALGGWTFWTWKFYNDDNSKNGWSMRSMVNHGFIQV